MTELSPGTTFAVVIPQTAPEIIPASLPNTDVIVVPTPGPPGPRGPGGLGAEIFEHVQATPAASWLIEHPGGRPPVGLMVLVDNQEVIVDVEYSSTIESRVTLTFAFPTAGRVLYL